MLDKIWIVDDDDVYHYTARRLLERSNLCTQIVTYTSSEEAIKNLETDSENLPDIILLDINMPVLNGWQFLNRVEKSMPELAQKKNVIMVSSSDASEDIDKSAGYSMVRGFIVKPLTIDKLKTAISNI